MGKPFSTEKYPRSKSHRKHFRAAKSDVNQGESRASPAELTAGQPEAMSGSGLKWDLLGTGIAAWCGEPLRDAQSS